MDCLVTVDSFTVGETALEPGESDLELRWISVARVVDMALNGLIPHADSAYAVLAAKVRGLL